MAVLSKSLAMAEGRAIPSSWLLDWEAHAALCDRGCGIHILRCERFLGM